MKKAKKDRKAEAFNAEAARRLEKAAQKAEARMPEHALVLRARQDNLDRVKSLMALGCNPVSAHIATRETDGGTLQMLKTTAFHEACAYGAVSVVAHFIDSGCDRSVKDGFDMRPQDVISNKGKDKRAHAKILALFFEAEQREARQRKEHAEAIDAATHPVTSRSFPARRPIKFED